MGHGKIILISGTSSSGKSALAKGSQKSLVEPFLHLQLDSYIEMLPDTDDREVFQSLKIMVAGRLELPTSGF